MLVLVSVCTTIDNEMVARSEAPAGVGVRAAVGATEGEGEGVVALPAGIKVQVPGPSRKPSPLGCPRALEASSFVAKGQTWEGNPPDETAGRWPPVAWEVLPQAARKATRIKRNPYRLKPSRSLAEH